MRKTILTATLLAIAALATPRHIAAQLSLHIEKPGFSLHAGPPIIYGPPLAVGPPPVVYEPPVYYRPPHKHHWKHWKKHYGRHHGHGHHGHWDD